LIRIERDGRIELSQLLADTLHQAAPELTSSEDDSLAGTMLADHASRVGLIGKSLELPELVDWEGNPIDLKQGTGELLLVDFWATDCLPCLQEMPRLRRLHAEFADRGLTILGVNVNSSPEDARRYLQSQQLPWRQARLSDAPGMEAAFLKQHGIRTIPFTMLVNRDGTISTIHAYGQNLEAKVRLEMLNLLAPESGASDSLIP
jgi:thiol-disulfide isomerase/thioredoxin